MSITSDTFRLSAKRLKILERSGRYEEALEAFGPDWTNEDFLPTAEGRTPLEHAEILLRFASLVGFYGFKHGVRNAQERSRDLLTRVRETFLESGDTERVAECENYIGLSYWRSGEFREGLAWVESALAQDLPAGSPAKLYAEVARSLIYNHLGRIDENIENCLEIESTMREYGDAFLNGSLSTNIALSYKRRGDVKQAQKYLLLARHFHEKSRHKPYLGTVHNNLAQLYKAEQKFVSAHESADAAIAIYKKIKDRAREASTWDTKAQIFFAERKLSEALAMADRSIKLNRSAQASADLAESLLTKAKILLFSDEFAEAVLCLVEAVNITRHQNGDHAAKALITEFEAAIDEKRSAPVSGPLSAKELELVVPASLAGYDDYKGVWIKTGKLRKAGVPRGSLAIVAACEVERGDLVAILELKDRVVSCGYYDSDFGIVCLESEGDEPELFDADEVEVLGKIVGVCRTGKDASGKMVVEPLVR